MIHYGLWQYKQQVLDSLATFQTIEGKKDGLKAQLRFRDTVLQQKPITPKVYTFSKRVSPDSDRRVSLTWQELRDNLLTLVENAFNLPTSQEDGQVPGYGEWFNIVYDDDQAVYTYKLLDDYRDGDLKILVSSC
ncbi:spindlin-3-like [Saccoglossus kowalevskii]|uniref:Spindlin-Z-like n=1 Tax=Saccoglossus kowalevskii TaxID=10224 RepID=A0ABM0MQC1_SACKO|nr:PREDICTED: spindlin-Z-like [Saccoglossus kowalevskii]